MKEATGELNMTVVTVVAIAAVGAFFYFFIWPGIQAGCRYGDGYCDSDPAAYLIKKRPLRAVRHKTV